MVTCSGCGRTIEKVPDWLSAVTVDFVCNNCPNRQTKNIAFISLEAEVKAAAVPDEDDLDVEELPSGEPDL